MNARSKSSVNSTEKINYTDIYNYFQSNGHFQKQHSFCYLTGLTSNIYNCILNTSNIRGEIINTCLYFYGTNALDFLSYVYDPVFVKNKICGDIGLTSKERAYLEYCDLKCLGYIKQDVLAVAPIKTRASDIGFDLTLIKKVWEKDNLVMYDTGICLEAPQGMYIQIYPRSSLGKSGYMLANSVGIIDRGYTGTIKVTLAKININSEEISLPYKAVQAVLSPAYHAIVKENTSPVFITERAEKGHGSSGF